MTAWTNVLISVRPLFGITPDETTQLYPDLGLADVHGALAYDCDHVDDVRSTASEPASARAGRCTATGAAGFPWPTDCGVAG
jgi:hypothetical protein